MSDFPKVIDNKMSLKVVTSKLEPMLSKKCTFKALNTIFTEVDFGEYAVDILNMVATSPKNKNHVQKLAMTLTSENWVAGFKKKSKISMEATTFLLEQQFKNMATKFIIWKDIAKGRKATKYPSLSEDAILALFGCVEWKKNTKLKISSYYNEYGSGVVNTDEFLKQMAFVNRCLDWDASFEIKTPQDEIDFVTKYNPTK